MITLEKAQEMKEAGWDKDTMMVYDRDGELMHIVQYDSMADMLKGDRLRAPSPQEILDYPKFEVSVSDGDSSTQMRICGNIFNPFYWERDEACTLNNILDKLPDMRIRAKKKELLD